VASDKQKAELSNLMQSTRSNPTEKINNVLTIFKDCKVDEWALQLKEKYVQIALQHLEDTAVLINRKKPLMELAEYLVQRES
jgi:geranylgeranyl diphosphate synthase type II